MALDGVVADLQRSNPGRYARIKLINRDDPRALELIRHDCAHVLAKPCSRCRRHAGHHRRGDQTVSTTTSSATAFTPEDFAAIEKKCARSSRATNRSRKRSIAQKDQAGARQGRGLQGRAGRRHSPATSRWESLFPGRLVRPLPRPRMSSTGKVGDAFKLMKVAAPVAWQANNPMLTRIYDGVHQQEEARRLISQKQIEENREARPPQARPRAGPVSLPGRRPRHRVLAPKGCDHLPGADRLYTTRLTAIQRGQRTAILDGVIGNFRPLGLVPRNMFTAR